MFKKTIISLLILEVLLIVGIFVSIAYDANEAPEVEIEEVVTFTNDSFESTIVDLETFSSTENEAYADYAMFQIDFELLDDVDTDKIVELVDNGLQLSIVGKDLSTQAIGDILGIEDVSNTYAEGAEITGVMISKTSRGYDCGIYGNVYAEVTHGNGTIEDVNEARHEYLEQYLREHEIYCYSEDIYYASFNAETFNSAEISEFEKADYITIKAEVLSAIDSDKLVELMDMGIIVSVRGKNISSQEAVEALDFADICTYDSESEKADSVKIYKDGEGYVCEKGGYDIKVSENNKYKAVEID